jgi:hypothetical protein
MLPLNERNRDPRNRRFNFTTVLHGPKARCFAKMVRTALLTNNAASLAYSSSYKLTNSPVASLDVWRRSNVDYTYR